MCQLVAVNSDVASTMKTQCSYFAAVNIMIKCFSELLEVVKMTPTALSAADHVEYA